MDLMAVSRKQRRIDPVVSWGQSIIGKRMAFSLLELLVVVAVIGVLTGLLLPGLSKSRQLARRTQCIKNLRQIALATRNYADDNSDTLPNSGPGPAPLLDAFATYISRSGHSIEKVFACPADSFYADFIGNRTVFINRSAHKQALYMHSSYFANGWNAEPTGSSGQAIPGLVGVKLSTVSEPSKTILSAELGAFIAFSWHHGGKARQFPDAPNVLAFIDGHVSYHKIFWSGISGEDGLPFLSNPPTRYPYRWTP